MQCPAIWRARARVHIASPPSRAHSVGRASASGVRASGLGLAFAAALAVGSAPMLAASPANAHDQLVDTTIVTDPESGSAESVRLTFSAELIPVGTEITVRGREGATLTDGDATVNGRDVEQPLTDPLPAGEALASWRVVSSDGHPIEGAFGLVTHDNGTSEIVDASDVAVTELGAGPSVAPADSAAGGKRADLSSTAEPAASSTDSGVALVVCIAFCAVGVAAASLVTLKLLRRAAARKA